MQTHIKYLKFESFAPVWDSDVYYDWRIKAGTDEQEFEFCKGDSNHDLAKALCAMFNEGKNNEQQKRDKQAVD